jgi:hypothetical protein
MFTCYFGHINNTVRTVMVNLYYTFSKGKKREYPVGYYREQFTKSDMSE